MHPLVKAIADAKAIPRANIFHDGQAQPGAVGIAALIKTLENGVLVQRGKISCILKTQFIAG